jgi:hypothetical protein
MSESTPELLKRLADQGGRILLVGGEITNTLPDHIANHPRVTIWDDRKQGIENRHVPGSVKAIIWSRFTSHSIAAKLNNAVKALDALRFPMKTEREIKELMSAFNPPPALLTSEPVDPPAADQPEPKQLQAKGILSTFVATHIDLAKDYTGRGAKKVEGERLFALAQKSGVQTTIKSIIQCVGVTTRKMMNPDKPVNVLGRIYPASKPPSADELKQQPAEQPKQDDFAELEELIANAIVAMQLVQEHLPKVRKETERLRGLRQRMMTMLKDES